MSSKTNVARDIDEYIARAPERARPILEKVRRTIAEAAPGAREAISYAIPTFTWSGNLVHFAAYDAHIGLYPAPSGTQGDATLAAYASGKGTLRFPLDEPIPYGLITKVVKLRLKELADAATRKETKAGRAAKKTKAGRVAKKTKAGRAAKKTKKPMR
jgi:uncharacterized protein YdhG (YjbR/CyaY superfamily)